MPGRAVVVGCGIVGACVALELARRGLHVTVVDRFPSPARGSTRLSSAVIRCHYGEPEAIKIAHEGRATWAAWADHLGLPRARARFVRCGVLFLLREISARTRPSGTLGVKAEANGADLRRMVAGMRHLGVGCDLLHGRALREAFPFFAFEDRREVGLVEHESGYVTTPRAATLDVVEAAGAAGVRFRLGERVTSIETAGEDPRRVTAVRTDRGRIPAEIVVNAAGPWSHALNLLARCPLPLTTVPLAQAVIEVSLAREPEPRLPATLDLCNGFYLRPSPHGVRLGASLPRDHLDFRASAEERADAATVRGFVREKLAALRSRWPGARVRAASPRFAYYDWTAADGYPLIDRTDLEGYFVAIGTSGAWFKGAPVIGRLVAELVANPSARRVRLPRTGHVLDLAVFSRRRAPLA